MTDIFALKAQNRIAQGKRSGVVYPMDATEYNGTLVSCCCCL